MSATPPARHAALCRESGTARRRLDRTTVFPLFHHGMAVTAGAGPQTVRKDVSRRFPPQTPRRPALLFLWSQGPFLFPQKKKWTLPLRRGAAPPPGRRPLMESGLDGRDRVPLLVRPVGAGLIGPGVLSPSGHVTVSIPEGPEDPAGLEGIVLPVVGAGPADLGIHDPLVSGFHKNHLGNYIKPDKA